MKIELEVTRITVVRGNGTDKISMTFKGTSPYTYAPGDQPSAHFDVTADYAEEWLKKNFGLGPESIDNIIDLRKIDGTRWG